MVRSSPERDLGRMTSRYWQILDPAVPQADAKVDDIAAVNQVAIHDQLKPKVYCR